MAAEAHDWEDASGEQADRDNARLRKFAASLNSERERAGQPAVTLVAARLGNGRAGAEGADVGGKVGGGGAAGLAAFTGMFERIFGKRVVFFRASAEIGKNGWVARGEAGTIYVNIAAKAPAHVIMGHELGHSLREQNGALWQEMRDMIMRLSPMSPEYRKAREGQGYGEAEDEWVSDVLGQHFDDPKFWAKLQEVAERRGQGGRFKEFTSAILKWLDDFLGRFRMGLSSEADGVALRAAEDLRDKIADVLARYSDEMAESGAGGGASAGGADEAGEAGGGAAASSGAEEMGDGAGRPGMEERARLKAEYDAVVASYTNADGTKKPGWLKAPNGEETNLTEQQWVQVRTPSFKEWFGDWENDPANASKVVDENGEPLVVDHSTAEDFTVFDKARQTGRDRAFYFSSSRRFAGQYGAKTIEAFVNLRNPVDYLTSQEDGTHDGFWFERGTAWDEIGVYSPEQIKSATGNSGAFSPGNPDIYASIGGEEMAGNLDARDRAAGRAEAASRLAGLGAARRMEAEKRGAREIRLATGWERGGDGKWRWELDDSGARLKAGDWAAGSRTTLGEVLEHEELFAAYPELREMPVVFQGYNGPLGRYLPESGEIELHPKVSLSILLHEVQHAIQHREGFEAGSQSGALAWLGARARPELLRLLAERRKNRRAPTYEEVWGGERTAEGEKGYAEFLRKWKGAKHQRELDIADQYGAGEELYRRIGGEVEARNVQRRHSLSAEERRGRLLSETEDVAREDQVFIRSRLAGGINASTGAEAVGSRGARNRRAVEEGLRDFED
ncbi:MAG: hypothetical protein LBC18_00935, partial [Opitutaceae bacterium]|nr:hypothetical protein [Opitutaceae bacterium]